MCKASIIRCSFVSEIELPKNEFQFHRIFPSTILSRTLYFKYRINPSEWTTGNKYKSSTLMHSYLLWVAVCRSGRVPDRAVQTHVTGSDLARSVRLLRDVFNRPRQCG